MTSLRRPAALAAITFVLALGLVPAWTGATDETDDALLDQALIAEVIEILRERYVDDDVLTSERLTEGAIRGIVGALGDDGHTQFLTEEEFEIEQDVLQGRVAGVGVILDARSSAPRIVAVVDGSPADRAGLRAGDVIVSIDEVETARLPQGDLADRVRGAPGSTVRLGIERPGSLERQSVSLRREEVEVDPVSWAMAPGSDAAVIRIVQFSVGTGREVRKALLGALEAGATAIVLDLRGNPGGLVAETVGAASLLLDGGVAYLERARDEAPVEIPIDPGHAIAADMPVVVLVDYGTASSGEILAAALRDNGRALLVGEQTFGTGTILNTERLSDGSAVRLGVREWLTPAGAEIFGVGLAPDEAVSLPPGAVRLGPGDLLGLTPVEFEDSDDVPLRRAVRLAEAAE